MGPSPDPRPNGVPEQLMRADDGRAEEVAAGPERLAHRMAALEHD
jgi:hypothetical protein